MNRERTDFKIGSRAQRLARMIVVLLTLTGVVAGTCLPTSLGAVEKNTTRLSAEYSGNWWETYDYTPDGSDASYIYNLYTKTTDASKFDMGDTVIFVPSSVSAPSYSAGVPDSSAILRKCEKATDYDYDYYEKDVDFYVSVQRAAQGFDYCQGGTLNKNLQEYNCWFGGVRGLGGSTYLYQKVPFLTKITVDLKKDDESWSGRTVTLRKDGNIFPLPEVGDGVYSDNHFPTGTYDVYVDGKDSGYDVTASKQVKENGSPNGKIVNESWTESGQVCYSNVEVDQDVSYHTYTVTTKLDGEPSQVLGEATLTSNETGSGGHVAAEYWGKSENGVSTFIVSDTDTYDHEVYNDTMGGTGFIMNTANRDVTIEFFTMTVDIHSDEVWNDATVALKDDNGCILGTMTYDAEKSDSEVGEDGKVDNVYMMYRQLDVPLADYSVWIDGLNVHKTLKTTLDDRSTDVDYYTVNVTINEDDAPWESAEAKIDNGSEIYTLPFNTTTQTYKKNVYLNVNNGTERAYTLTVNGTIDGGDKETLTSENKTTRLDYYSLTYYSYDKTGDMSFAKQSEFYRKQHVRRDNTATPVADAYIEGMNFNCWNEDEWSFTEDGDSIEKFDYTTVIDRKYVLYAHFKTPTVVINGYIKTNTSGKVDADGKAYILPNTTIVGFEKGSSSVRTLIIEATNEQEIHFFPKTTGTGFTIEQTSGDALEDGGGGVKVAKSSTITITFDEKVSMAEAQDFLRNYVVYIPQEDVDSSVRISVSDGVVNAQAETTIDAKATTTNWQALSGSANARHLSAGYYYLSGNYTVSNTLYIDGNVYIYLNGYTLTATGTNANGRNGGTAGIRVPSGKNLYTMGKGTINARGGNAANGGNGDSATSSNEDSAHWGGNGGGGAGAGIGGNGGYGGAGGAGHAPEGDGSSGGGGGNAEGCGYFYADGNVVVNATGGSRGYGGSGGGRYHCGAGGGGGGGGAAGYDIGTGGGAGGGGGGSCSKEKHKGKKDESAHGGGGGACGYGRTNGTNGGTGASGNWSGSSRFSAGSGGGGGNGTYSRSKYTYNALHGINTYDIKFEGADSDETRTYTFVNNPDDTNFSVPNFSDYPKGTFFVGWQLSQVAKGIVSTPTYEMTNTSNTKKYQPGAAVTVKSGTYGNIIFQPVTKGISGLNANSETQVVPDEAEEVVYHKFEITTTLDGKNADMGEVKLVDASDSSKKYVLTSGIDAGKYDITLTEEHTFKIYVNNEDTGRTVSSDGRTTVPFESVKVYIKGKTPTYVKLVTNASSEGQTAPVLTKQKDQVDGWDEYLETHIKPAEASDANFDIVVDGNKVSGKTAKSGTPVYLEYHNVTLTVGGNAVGEIGDNGVLLWNADHSARIVAEKISNGVYRANTFASSDVYTIEVNGMPLKDDAGNSITADFNQDSTKTANYYHIYANIRLDGAPYDMGAVTVNDQRAAKTGGVGARGSYEYYALATGSKDYTIKVAGKGSTEDAYRTLSLNAGSKDADTTAEFDYFTVTYVQREDLGEKLYYTSSIQLPQTDSNLRGFASGEIPERADYSFIGWSASASATEPTYTFSNHSVRITEPITLYAVWQPNPYLSGNVQLDYTYTDYNGNQQIAPYEVQEGEDVTRRLRELDLQVIARNSEGEDVTYLIDELKDGNDHKAVTVSPNDTRFEITYVKDGEEVTETYQEGYLYGEGTEEQQAEAKAAVKVWQEQPLANQKPLVYKTAYVPYDFGTLPGSYLGSALTYEVRCNNDAYNIKLKWYKTTESDAAADATKEGLQLGKDFNIKYHETPENLTNLVVDVDANFTSNVGDRIPSVIEFKFTDKDDATNTQSVLAYYDGATKKYHAEVYGIESDYNLSVERYYLLGKWKEPDADKLDYFAYSQIGEPAFTEKQEGEDASTTTYNCELKEHVNTLKYADGDCGETVNNKPDDQSIWKYLQANLSDKTPTTRGFKFTGWLSTNDSKTYQPSDVYPTDVIQDDTLTAQWEVNKRKINYAGMKDVVVEGELPTEYVYTEDTSFNNELSREGYRFLGWKIVNDADDKLYSMEDGVTLKARAYDADITVEATWGLLTYITVEVTPEFTSPDSTLATRRPEAIEIAVTVSDYDGEDIVIEAPYDETTGKYVATIDRLGTKFSVAPSRYKINGTWVDANSTGDEHFTYEQTSHATPVNQKETFKAKITEKIATMNFDEGDTQKNLTQREEVANMPSYQNMWVNYECKVPNNTPTARGLTFTGWLSANDGKIYQPGDVYATGIDHFKTDTLTAQWSVNTYNIKYTGMDDVQVDGELPTVYTYDQDSVINQENVNNVRRDGYRFLGWRIVNDHQDGVEDTLYLPAVTLGKGKYDTDVTLEANWDILTYIDVNVTTDFTTNDDARYPQEIEFQLNGTDVEDGKETFTAKLDLSSKTYKTSFDTRGEDFSITPTRYRFGDDNWIEAGTDAVGYFDYAETSERDDATRHITFNVTLTEPYNTLVYEEGDAHGETITGVPSKQTIWIDYPAKVASKIPTTRGYTFAGWQSAALVDEAGSAIVFQAESDYPTDVIQDDTLTAQWDVNHHTIHYEGLEDATIEGQLPQDYAYDTDTLVDNKMTKPDWIFLGWKINDDDTLYEEKVTLEARAYDEDITLTAIWGPLMYMNVNIDADFTSPDDTRIPTEMEFALKVVDQPRYNTTFTATYDAEKKALVADIASLGEEFNIELQSYTINGKTYEPDDPFIDYFTYDTGNQTRGEGRYITFSQTLKEWINTVTYNEGNTFGETVEGVPGEFSVWRHHPSTLVTGTPTTRGYTFAGWKSAKDGKVYQPGDAYSTDTIQDDTLTAQWTVNTYKITYTGLEEATVDGDLPSVYAYDQASVVKNAITKDKYRFLGWKINGGEDVSSTPTTLEAKKYTEDITLDAVWGYVTKINVDVSTWFTSNNEARYPEEIEFRLIVDGDESNPILFTASFDKTTKTYTTTYEALGDHFVIAPTRYKIDGVWHDATSDKSKYFTYQEVSVEKGQDTAVKFNEKLDEVVNLLSYAEGDTSNEAVENVPESENIWLYTAANVASETPTSRGFTFSGWKSEKLDTVFQPGESYPTDTEISDDTLTAQWNPNEYKIKYAGLKDASVQGEQPETYVFNTGASVDCHPTKDGYDFQGWQILNDDDDTTYDSVVDLPAKKYAEDITLNAVWSPSANDKAETVNYVGEEDMSNINNNRQNREFAIVNLIFVIGALMAAILCGLKRTKWWKLDVALTAVAVVLFILTTGYDKVVLFNTWTIVFVALFALSFLPPMRAKFENS